MTPCVAGRRKYCQFIRQHIYQKITVEYKSRWVHYKGLLCLRVCVHTRRAVIVLIMVAITMSTTKRIGGQHFASTHPWWPPAVARRLVVWLFPVSPRVRAPLCGQVDGSTRCTAARHSRTGSDEGGGRGGMHACTRARARTHTPKRWARKTNACPC